MEQKLNRLVRGCIECKNDSNPIQSIHDQGAGGNGIAIANSFSSTLDFDVN